MMEPMIITGTMAGGGTLYAAVNPSADRMGAIGHSAATACLAPYRSQEAAVAALVGVGAAVEDQHRKGDRLDG